MTSYNPPLYYFNGINFNDDYFELPNTTSSGVSQSYIDNNFLKLTGGTLSGALTGTTINSTSFVEGGTALSSKYLNLAGGTLTGALTGTTINATSFVEGGTALTSKYLGLGGGTLTGSLIALSVNALVLQENYIDLSNKYLALAGGTLTGAITGTTINATSFVEGGTALTSKYLRLIGGTLTGALTGTTINATSFVEGGTALTSKYLNLAGGTLTGNLITNGSIDIGTTLTITGGNANYGIGVDAGNMTNTYISFKPAGTNDDWCYLRQIGGANAIKLSLDFHDDNNDARFCIRNIQSTNTPDTITEVFTVDNGNVSATGTINATSFVENGTALSAKYLGLGGGTLTGTTTINNSLTANYLTVNASTGSTGYLGYYGSADSAGYYGGSSGTTTDLCATFNSSIWCKSKICISSDTRIKKNITDINDDSALEKILSIQPKTYNYIDVLKGTSNIYGFIAQQIKEVIPEAVSIQKDYIPNIYDLGTYSNNVIITSNIDISNIINTSNIVKVYDENNKEYLCKVNNILSSNSFVIDNSDLNTSNIFIYGNEVNDFNTLDKSYIFTLNVCATQILSRKIDILTSNLELALNRITALEGNL